MVEYSDYSYAKASFIAGFLTRISCCHLIYSAKMILDKCSDEQELSWWFCQCMKYGQK